MDAPIYMLLMQAAPGQKYFVFVDLQTSTNIFVYLLAHLISSTFSAPDQRSQLNHRCPVHCKSPRATSSGSSTGNSHSQCVHSHCTEVQHYIQPLRQPPSPRGPSPTKDGLSRRRHGTLQCPERRTHAWVAVDEALLVSVWARSHTCGLPSNHHTGNGAEQPRC